MLLISFHGGSGGINNVEAFGDHGDQKSEAVLGGNAELDELRGIAPAAAGTLWILSGSKTASAMYTFTGSADTYANPHTVVQYADGNALWHPFDLTFDGTGYVFVSNQDTNVVARYQLDGTPVNATSLPTPDYLPGTFVGSATKMPHVNQKLVDTPAGLEADVAKKKSVRGVLWTGALLYVADEEAGVVKTYDADGTYQGESTNIGSPVHLLLVGQTLYVANGNGVFSGALSATPQLTPVKGIDATTPAGMAYDGGTHLFVADRKAKLIRKYTNFPAGPNPAETFVVHDEPEFVVHLAD